MFNSILFYTRKITEVIHNLDRFKEMHVQRLLGYSTRNGIIKDWVYWLFTTILYTFTVFKHF